MIYVAFAFAAVDVAFEAPAFAADVELLPVDAALGGETVLEEADALAVGFTLPASALVLASVESDAPSAASVVAGAALLFLVAAAFGADAELLLPVAAAFGAEEEPLPVAPAFGAEVVEVVSSPLAVVSGADAVPSSVASASGADVELPLEVAADFGPEAEPADAFPVAFALLAGALVTELDPAAAAAF